MSILGDIAAEMAEKPLLAKIEVLRAMLDELLAELEKAAEYHRSHECYAEAKRLDDYIAAVKGRAA